MSQDPSSQPPAPGWGQGWPSAQGQPPGGPSPGPPGYSGHPQAPRERQPAPQDQPTALNPPAQPPEVPLHPLLPGGSPTTQTAHHQPHAASAGPAEGARGAMWFAIGLGIIVVVCLLGALVILAGG